MSIKTLKMPDRFRGIKTATHIYSTVDQPKNEHSNIWLILKHRQEVKTKAEL